jgi:hypothetical protein
MTDWTSVADSLPTRNQDVLVWSRWITKGGLGSGRAEVAACDSEDRWYDQDDDYFGRNAEVTHWMPLPEPPK